jgi:hypothetical protein
MMTISKHNTRNKTMKSGMSISEMAVELERRREAKKDFIVPTNKMLMDETTNRLSFGEHVVDLNNHAHSQIASNLAIPKPYYDKMRQDHPRLLAQNVNGWFYKNPQNRMLRTLDGVGRAYLSDKYRPLENDQLAEAVLPVLMDMQVIVWSSAITDTKFYLKVVDEKITKDIPRGGGAIGDGGHTIFDTLCPALVISNSEVGSGRLMVQTSVFTRACTNLATFNDRSIAKHHVGGRHEITDGFEALLSDETKRKSDEALWMQVRDVVKNAFDRAKFEQLADRIAGSTEDKIEDVIKTVDLTAKRFNILDGEKKSILKHLVEGGDLSRYGLFNAVTRTAEDLGDYDRATEFENLGGTIIDLTKTDWRELVAA